MNNDLISRSALKEDFKTRYKKAEEWIKKADDKEIKIRATATRDFILEVILTIDNAPTIKPTITCKECDGYEAGYSAGQHDARPKGKWLILNGDKVCSFCMTGTSHNTNASISFFQFCPYCGADMRVKDEEDSTT